MTPSMLDLASTQQFVEMTSAYLGVIEDTGVKLDHDFFSFLITIIFIIVFVIIWH